MIIKYLRVDIQYKKHFPTFVHLAHAQLLNQTARQPFWSSSPLLNSTTAYFLCQAIEPVKFSLSNLLIHRPCCVDKMDESRSDPKLKFFRRHFLCPQGGKKSQGQGKHGVLCYSKLRVRWCEYIFHGMFSYLSKGFWAILSGNKSDKWLESSPMKQMKRFC